MAKEKSQVISYLESRISEFKRVNSFIQANMAAYLELMLPEIKKLEPFETIICAAVHRDGRTIMWHRHNWAIRAAADAGWKAPLKTDEQGFITSKNRYVDRKEAMLIARNAGQTESKSDELYSEDLY